jgi:Protein of unknown function (DUF3501)
MKLTLADIADTRAYEREREAFRDHIVALKKLRRVQVGNMITFVFENRETMRFQIQEMARVEKIFTDAGIQGELDTYNTLIPEPGQLSATMFIELTSELALREWLPRLVGIERALVLRLPGDQAVHAVVEEQHAQQLTREDITSSVHYVRFELTDDQIAAFRAGPVELVVDHPELQVSATLGDQTRAELLADLAPETRQKS